MERIAGTLGIAPDAFDEPFLAHRMANSGRGPAAIAAPPRPPFRPSGAASGSTGGAQLGDHLRRSPLADGANSPWDAVVPGSGGPLQSSTVEERSAARFRGRGLAARPQPPQNA
eukprot:7392175-Alexandrium_andersonii.AAC.1